MTSSDTVQMQNKETVKRIYTERWKGTYEVIDDIFSTDVKHDQFLPNWPTGREGFKELLTFSRDAFPDIHEDAVELITEEKEVASRLRLRGTPGTGRTVDIYGAEIFKFQDGMVTEYLYHEDTPGLFFELG